MQICCNERCQCGGSGGGREGGGVGNELRNLREGEEGGGGGEERKVRSRQRSKIAEHGNVRGL